MPLPPDIVKELEAGSERPRILRTLTKKYGWQIGAAISGVNQWQKANADRIGRQQVTKPITKTGTKKR